MNVCEPKSEMIALLNSNAHKYYTNLISGATARMSLIEGQSVIKPEAVKGLLNKATIDAT